MRVREPASFWRGWKHSFEKLVYYATSLIYDDLHSFKVWDTLTTYKCIKTMEGHSGIVLALCTHEYVNHLRKLSNHDHFCISSNFAATP